MKLLMLGAGGIGCYYAARLVDAGHDVVLVARGAHLQALQQQGLAVTHPDFELTAPVAACDMAALQADYRCAEFDLIMLATKATATASLMAELADWLGVADTPVLSLQNGVGNEPLIAEVIGMNRTLGGLAVRIGGHIIAPGQVAATGVAQIEMGAWPDAVRNPGWQPTLLQWQAALVTAGIPCTLSDDIQQALWRKLVINNGVNPLSALTWLTTRSMTSDPVLGRIIQDMMDETVRAAQHLGVGLTAQDAADMFQLISDFDDIKTSMLVDREKGHPLEVDEICLPVIEPCRQAGQPAQTTERIHRLLMASLAREG
ncbi:MULTISPECIES: ketopantoate reductase family protein [unclassified Oceanobacter]|uniref:ketopantoate reductase family protein n=1 Tax=unclassified Oceanobacter TaxID=2620260 RepID=UPI0026E21320|nr:MULTISPECIES: 2-dehydropantoate 2-reductase [unclassified Oceanobacter]MDO6683378.1 2-dehydropantoate 2-reductase [Oceanobacter sp. 5_MG-2023]MDP2506355.1 2-dehydropantoate 2-reductase [Oceanobacter sp. 3_MG-2023]MDP2549321.1 2-dehydropantoate 2-reductase [Oceanobacter sp. 4_MG-2023]